MFGILVVAIAFGIVIFPMMKWAISMTQNISEGEKHMESLGERMEIQAIISDFLNQINELNYTVFEKKISTKGKTWTEDIGGKYTLSASFGNEGKYVGSTCNTSLTPAVGDKSCRNGIIKVSSKTDSSKSETVDTARVGVKTEAGDTLPIGTILPYKGTVSSIPEKWALCNGQTVNGITTPNLSGRFLEGTTSSPGSFISAGLPNITANSGTSLPSGRADLTTIGTGAMRMTATTQSDAEDGDGAVRGPLSFDASWANSIYGASSTVQPSAYTVLFIMKVKN